MNETMPDWSSLSTSQKANFIRFAVAAQRRGDPIDITNLAEAWKQFYGDYQLACGGKLHSEGGNLFYNGGNNLNIDATTGESEYNSFAEGGNKKTSKSSNKTVYNSKTVYKSKYTGNVWNTKEDAEKDNEKYFEDPLYRFDLKAKQYPKYENFNIPFIEDKRLTLTDAGLATGAIISENLLDSIAKNAVAANLPIKTALGLAVKESTLGNPTDDRSFEKLIGKDKAQYTLRGKTAQYLNTTGLAVNARELVNYYKDTWNPYEDAIEVAKRKANKLVPNPDGNVYDSSGNIISTRFYHDDPGYEEWKKEVETADRRKKEVIDSVLISGESFANAQAEKRRDKIKGNVLQAAFEDYKNNPNGYNPGQSNYPQLVDKRGDEIWNSPEVQNWYRNSIYAKALGGNLFSGTNTRSQNLKNPATYHSVVNPFLIDFVIKEEGFLDKPTNIGDGKITIGSGLTDPKWIAKYRKNGNKWTTNNNLKAVEEELLTREAELRKIIPNWDDLPDSSKQGLLSYKYNYNFTKDNSPKMFEALKLGNLREVARQMNATSKNPKFAAGLSQRRGREQELFLQDIVNGVGNQSWHEELPQDAIQSQNPIVIEPKRVSPIYVPVNINNNYVEASAKGVQDDTAGLKALNAFRNALSFEHTMQDQNQKLYQDQPVWDPLDVINNPQEFFKLKGNGGNLERPANIYGQGDWLETSDDSNFFTLKSLDEFFKKSPNNAIYSDHFDTPYLTKDTWESLSEEDKKWQVKKVNWNLEGEGNVSLTGPALQEVVITPSKEDKAALHNAKAMWRDNELRNQIYEDLLYANSNASDVEMINTLANIYKNAKKPSVHKDPDTIVKLLGGFKRNDGSPRPYMRLFPYAMYNVNNLDNFIAELSHAYQFKNPNASKIGLNTLGLPGDMEWYNNNGTHGNERNSVEKSNYTTYLKSDGYDRPGHYEFNAHTLIEPSIYNVVWNRSSVNPNSMSTDIDTQLKDTILARAAEEAKFYEESYPVEGTYGMTGPGDRRFNVENGKIKFQRTFHNGGNLLALGTDDVEDPEEYSGWLSEFNVTPTSSGQYLQGYDENGRKVYTIDPNQKMSYDFTADRLAKWDEKFRNSQLPNTGEQWANIATGAIGLPMIATSPVTGALVGDLVGDLITHPIANAAGFGTGYLGNRVDKSLGITSAVNKVLPDKINLPEGTIGEFVGYPLGRFSKDVGTKLMNEDVKNAIVNNVGSALGNSNKFKRFVEVAGQTGDINPLPYMKNYFLKDAWRPKEWPHLKETVNYIFTGKGNPRKAFFAKVPEQYPEFGEGEFLIPNIGTDPTNPRTGYLRAVLFGEEPGTDLIKLGTADDVFIGEHAKTIAERGYDPKKVRVYTTDKSNDFPINDPKVIESAEKAFQEGNIISTSGEGSFKTKTGTYDAGGHRVFTVKDPTSNGYYPAFRQDFTDFSYLPYKQRWLKGSREPGIFTKIGLKAVDEATTPIIVRTGWEEARKPIGMSYVGSEYYNKLVKGLLKANPGILKEIGIGPSL